MFNRFFILSLSAFIALVLTAMSYGQAVNLNQSQTTLLTPTFKINDPPAASYTGGFGIRGGVGTNIEGGLAFGGSLNYLIPTNSYWNPYEISLLVFAGSSEETTVETNTYVENTDILVIGLLANYLIHYNHHSQTFFLLLGAGIGFIDVQWEESSEGDISLGTPLPGGGSKQSEEGSAIAFLFDIGLGYKFSDNVDFRFEIPVFYSTDSPGSASSVALTFVLTLGTRFN